MVYASTIICMREAVLRWGLFYIFGDLDENWLEFSQWFFYIFYVGHTLNFARYRFLPKTAPTPRHRI